MAMKSSRLSGGLLRLQNIFASNKFFYGIIAFITVTSLWVAISSLYPMAFDEDFHLGLIKIYAEIWNPFSVIQTPEAAAFGSITTDPSYLFHYLMSFPYRILSAVTSNEMVIVICLRLINIALFVLGLLVYRKVLLRAKISSSIVNAVFAMFVLIPVVPLLAGQINYDNLLVLIVAGVFWFTLDIRERLRSKQSLPVDSVLWLVVLLLFSSVVKYAFLPIAAGVVFYIAYEVIRVLRQDKEVSTQFFNDAKKLSLSLKIIFGVLLLIGMLLFCQRYVVNVVRYHDPVPDCAAVISVEECSQYGPWGRDNMYSQNKEGLEQRNALEYTATHWVWGMWYRLYFTLAGSTNGFATQKPLPIPSVAAIVVVSAGILLAIAYGRALLRDYPIFILFIIVGALYGVALWFQVYQLYVFTGRPVAINGRYLIPLLPAFGVILAVAYSWFFTRIGKAKYKGIFACVLLLLFLQGGGPVTYIVRSEPNWYWSNSFIQNTNQNIQKILRPITIGD
jgi:hypothetical protein